jgi:hypothetical protein
LCLLFFLDIDGGLPFSSVQSLGSNGVQPGSPLWAWGEEALSTALNAATAMAAAKAPEQPTAPACVWLSAVQAWQGPPVSPADFMPGAILVALPDHEDGKREGALLGELWAALAEGAQHRLKQMTELPAAVADFAGELFDDSKDDLYLEGNLPF